MSDLLKTRLAKKFIHRSMTVRRANGNPGPLGEFSFLNMVDHCATPSKAPTVPGTVLDKKLEWLR